MHEGCNGEESEVVFEEEALVVDGGGGGVRSACEKVSEMEGA